jgi:hypothetical protein
MNSRSVGFLVGHSKEATMIDTKGKINKAAKGNKVGTSTKPEFIIEGTELDKAKKDKIIMITLREGERGRATFTPNVKGHDVDVVAMRLKRMYRMYREQQRKEEMK